MKVVSEIVAALDRGRISTTQAIHLLNALVASAANEKTGLLDEWAMKIWAGTPDEIDFTVSYRMAHHALEARARVSAKLKSGELAPLTSETKGTMQ